MQGKRTERYAELIKQSLSQSILTKIRDPRMGFVTVTRVEITPDLKFAKVFYTVLGDEKVHRSTAAALDHARGFLQREIANEIEMRIVPTLQFQFDKSVSESIKIEEILKKINEEQSE